MSIHTSTRSALAYALILTGALTGCATNRSCGGSGCLDDAKITSNVQTLFDQHPELGPPNSIDVQTVNHVVYLNGFVDERLQSRTAESVAFEAPGVTRVVNSIAVTH